MTSSGSEAAKGRQERGKGGDAAMPRMRSVLLVEPDPALADRLIEAAWAFGGLEPIHVEDRERAEAALASHRVDVVVSATMLADGSGFQLLSQLRHSGAYRDLPFLFLADDARVKTKIAAFRMGAHDYLVKPVAVGELCARITSACCRVEEARGAAVDRGFSLAGDFVGMSFSELVGLLNTGRRSGRLSIETPEARGQLLLVEGQVYHAAFGDRWGEDAFYAVLFESEGRFEFLPERLDRNGIPNTVALSPTALLVEGARRIDEAVRNGSLPEAARPARADAGTAPDPALAEALAAELAQAAGRAHIVLRDVPSLADWTRAAADGPQVLGAVVSDAHRFAAWLGEAGPCALDTMFAEALEPGPRAPCVSWSFSNGRRFDALLLDHRSPGGVLEGVGRELAFVIVAPPHGTWKDLGIRARAELTSLLSRLRPRAVFGVGVVGLQGKLEELIEQVGLTSRCEMLEEEGSLLDWLRSAVERWGTAI